MRRQVFTLALENFLVVVWNRPIFGLKVLKYLSVEDLFNVCCSIICVVFASVCIFERFCHEHHFGLNSRIAAPKFCTKSRFYFLRGNLFEQFAPTLPKSKIA